MALRRRAVLALCEQHGVKTTKMVVDVYGPGRKCEHEPVPYIPVRRSNRELLKELERKGVI